MICIAVFTAASTLGKEHIAAEIEARNAVKPDRHLGEHPERSL
jgi:hypothetical protein